MRSHATTRAGHALRAPALALMLAAPRCAHPASNVASRIGTLAAKPHETPAVTRPAPLIVHDPIHYGSERLAAMANYSLRHYGESSFRLEPRVIVLHFTDGPSYASARALFEADHPNRHERPGVCAHYIVDLDGTVYEVVPPELRCRHTIGLNDVAIGIEFVQPRGPSDRACDRAILARTPQRDAGVRLVRWLQARFGIANDDVIGHAMANRHARFHDREGWRNDHGDFGPDAVREFRTHLSLDESH